jgi:hypothetical protein
MNSVNIHRKQTCWKREAFYILIFIILVRSEVIIVITLKTKIWNVTLCSLALSSTHGNITYQVTWYNIPEHRIFSNLHDTLLTAPSHWILFWYDYLLNEIYHMNPTKLCHNSNYKGICFLYNLTIYKPQNRVSIYSAVYMSNYDYGNTDVLLQIRKFKQILTLKLTASFEVNTPDCIQGQI